MADKYSFLIKHETEHVLDALTDAQAGQLFRLLYAYSARCEIEAVCHDQAVAIAFGVMRGFLDRDTEKYKEKVKKRADAASKMWEKMKKMQMHANDANAQDEF